MTSHEYHEKSFKESYVFLPLAELAAKITMFFSLQRVYFSYICLNYNHISPPLNAEIMDIQEQILVNSFKLFLMNNFEKVTIEQIEQESGFTRRTLYRHFGGKEKLFIRVCDHFILKTQDIDEKVPEVEDLDNFYGFIMNYIIGIKKVMSQMFGLGIGNIYKYYFFLIMQANIYYPHFADKVTELNNKEYKKWEMELLKAIKNKEVKEEVDVKLTALQFRSIFLGMSFEKSLADGLDVDLLLKTYLNIYNQIKL